MLKGGTSGYRLDAAEVGATIADAEQPFKALAEVEGKIVAKWEREAKYDLGFTTKSILVWRDGKMFHQRYDVYEAGNDLGRKVGPGELRIDEVFERPTNLHNERRFDLDDGPRVEYMTLAESGDVKYFSWEGRRFAHMQATFIDRDAMMIGVNRQAKECVPTRLSPAAVEVVRLYRQLHGFKDDPEFAELGFSRAGPYHAWLEAIQSLDGRLDGEARMEAWHQLGIPIGDVMMLGMNYMQEAIGVGTPENRRHIQDLERTLQASLALAFCERSN